MTSDARNGPSAIHAARIARVRQDLKKQRVPALLVTRRMDHLYLTGFTGEDSAVLVLPRALHVLSDGRFDEVINQECPWMTRWMRKGSLNAEVGKVCKQLKLRSLAIQGDGMTVADQAEIRKLARGTRLTVAPPIFAEMRRIKDDTEIKNLKLAIRIAEEAFKALRRTIRIGQTELEMAAQLEYEMKKRGASGPSFGSIVAEGANAALPHAHPGRRRVRAGSAILFDWGARVGFYCSDLTRMLFIGSIPPKMANVYAIVLAAQEKAIAALRPGERMCDVDEVARGHIARAGFSEAFNHGLGHGLGLDVHEAPSLSWRSDEKLRAGMVVTVEPGIYLPGVGGVRIEDDVLVTSSGHRVLTRLDKSLTGAVV